MFENKVNLVNAKQFKPQFVFLANVFLISSSENDQRKITGPSFYPLI